MKYSLALLALIAIFASPVICMEEKIDPITFAWISSIKNTRKCACNLAFNSYEELESHMTDAHFDKKKQGYKCPYCDHKTSVKATMISHFPSHTKEKIFFCNICDFDHYTYQGVADHLNLHMSHKNIFNYLIKQNACRKNVNNKFKCPNCCDQYISTHRLVQHFKRTHQDLITPLPLMAPAISSARLAPTLSTHSRRGPLLPSNTNFQSPKLPSLITLLQQNHDTSQENQLHLAPLRSTSQSNDRPQNNELKLPPLSPVSKEKDKSNKEQEVLSMASRSICLFPTSRDFILEQDLITSTQNQVPEKRKISKEKKSQNRMQKKAKKI